MTVREGLKKNGWIFKIALHNAMVKHLGGLAIICVVGITGDIALNKPKLDDFIFEQ